jgi:hypothetical protein
VTDAIGTGSLKLVTGCSSARSLADAIGALLRERIGSNDVCDLDGDTFLVYTDAEPEAIRDWLAELLSENESALVVEFERWSGRGPAIDSRWLRRRGH